MKRLFFALCLLPLGLTGCDYGRSAEGTVRDRITHRRLQNVKYEVLREDVRDTLYSEISRTGHLYISIMLNGPDEDLVIRLTKSGYDTLVLKNPRDSSFYLTPLMQPHD
jgi:hypothetical protein